MLWRPAMKSIRIILPGIIAFTLFSSIALHAADVPAMDQIQNDYDAKKYQDVIREVALALPQSADASKGYDKATLLALKGESHLQLKQLGLAADAYTAAAKESADPVNANGYKAVAQLIRKSPGGIYQPKQPTTRPADAAGGKPQPINILDIDSRRDAVEALFHDEAKVFSAKLDALKKQTSLPPLMDGIKQISDLRVLEVAATGSDDTSKQMVASLADHAGELMSAAIKTMAANVDKVETLANQSNTSIQTNNMNGMAYTVTTKRGLISNEKSAHNDINNTAKN